jgi:gamma-D-glutamyl-L-lysine dipeptidyl-peptidase
MRTGICENAFIPLRAGMSHKSEMLSQILFGELFEIQISRGDWAKVRLLHDNYEGWVDETTITLLDENSEAIAFFENPAVCHETVCLGVNSDKILIPNGAKIPSAKNDFHINKNHYKIPSDFKTVDSTNRSETIISAATRMMNTPYLWGGRTAWGTDCSGFAQYLYALAGIKLPRDASQQVNLGRTLSFVSEAQPGDLAFFDNEEGQITHVGIICEQGKIIHASGKVKIDSIDHQGIYNKNLKRYTHNLRVVKSILW